MAIKLHKITHNTNDSGLITNGKTATYNVIQESGYGNARADYKNGVIEYSQGYKVDDTYKRFILTFGDIDLNDGYDTVAVNMGIDGTVASLKVKVDDEQIAEYKDITSTSWNCQLLEEKDIAHSKKALSGLLTIEVIYTGDYAGNYESVTFTKMDDHIEAFSFEGDISEFKSKTLTSNKRGATAL